MRIAPVIATIIAPIIPMVLVAIALLAVGPASADELRINDLRVEWSPVVGQDVRASGQYDHDIPALLVSQHSTLAADLTIASRRRVGIGYLRGLDALESDRGTFLVGLLAVYDRTETRYGSVGKAYILDGFAGWAWALAPSWHVEQGVLLGGGRSQWSLESRGGHFDGTDAHETSSAFIYEYGVRLGTTYCWKNIVVTADARYLVNSTRHTFASTYRSGGTTETSSWRPTIRSEGFGFSLGLGYRF